MKRFTFLIFVFASIFLTSCSTVNTEPNVTSETYRSSTDVISEPPVNEEGFLTKGGDRVSAETVEKYPQLTALPTLYLEFESPGGLSDVEHGVYSDATYTFVDGDPMSSYYNLPLKIKGRGNYSWSLMQKPYTLKLDKKADLAGMGKAKKWILVTVNSDKTMLRNYITQKCAKWLGLPGTCDNEFVDVVADGKYIGTYVLTEKIEIGENRIEADKRLSSLFEIEMVYRHTCNFCIVMYTNKNDPGRSVHLSLKSYHGKKPDELTVAERRTVRDEYEEFFKNVESAMKSGSVEELGKYIDTDSFVNWYLLNELTRNLDSMFVTSCYCFIDESGKLFMGPCWDYDTCYGAQIGESEGAWVRQAPWFDWLFEYNEPFKALCSKRWLELRRENNNIADWFSINMDAAIAQIAQSEKMEHELYPHSEFTDLEFDDAVIYMKQWLHRRFKWMDREFLPPLSQR